MIHRKDSYTVDLKEIVLGSDPIYNSHEAGVFADPTAVHRYRFLGRIDWAMWHIVTETCNLSPPHVLQQQQQQQQQQPYPPRLPDVRT
jgi:hypothetical protein